jgi:hypothetical protein
MDVTQVSPLSQSALVRQRTQTPRVSWQSEASPLQSEAVVQVCLSVVASHASPVWQSVAVWHSAHLTRRTGSTHCSPRSLQVSWWTTAAAAQPESSPLPQPDAMKIHPRPAPRPCPSLIVSCPGSGNIRRLRRDHNRRRPSRQTHDLSCSGFGASSELGCGTIELLCAAIACLAGCGEDAEISLLEPGTEAGISGSSSGGAAGDAGTDTASGAECTSSANCAGMDKFCNTEQGRCVECLAASQCESGQGCAPDGSCQEVCGSDPECTSGSLPFCAPGFSVCVECLGDADCDTEQPFCQPSLKRCVECLVDGHCESAKTCDQSEFQCND